MHVTGHNVRRLFGEPSEDMVAILDREKQLLAHMQQTLAAVAATNDRGLAVAREIAGDADTLVRDLRRVERNRTNVGEGPTSSKEIAAHLRQPLEVLQRLDAPPQFRPSAGAIVKASGTVRRVLDHAPRGQVLCVTTRHELGVGKYTLLEEIAGGLDVLEQAA